MNKKQQKEFLLASEAVMSQKQISKDELKEYLEDVFKKAFGRNYEEVPYEKKDIMNEIEDADILVDINFDEFLFSVKRRWRINNGEIPFEKIFLETSIKSSFIENKDLKDGEEFIQEIHFDNLTDSKRRQITQLLIQRSKEKEKEKIFDRYKNLENKLIQTKVLEIRPNNTLLSFEDEIIFLSNLEKSPIDKFNEGELVKTFVTEVNQFNKKINILVSRTRTQFITSLFQEENEDVKNGTIQIKRIARESGIKTKVAVSSSNPTIDPVGSIIGPRGAKIKNIISEIKGEIIDVVQYSDDPKTLIKNLFHPAKVKGVYADEDARNAAVMVEDNELLQAIGKNGVNVKLVAKITGFKIDVIPRSKMGDYNFQFEMVKYSHNNTFNKPNNTNFELKVKSIDELIEDGDKLEEEDLDYFDWIEDEEQNKEIK